MWEWLSDFHLLLWISKDANFAMTGDMKVLVTAVLQHGQVGDPCIEAITNLAGILLPAEG
jgi:hypothetical protein